MHSECFKRGLCLLFFTITIGNNLVAQKKVEVEFNISAGNSTSIIDFGNNNINKINGNGLGKFNLNFRVSTSIFNKQSLNNKSSTRVLLGAGLGGLVTIDGTTRRTNFSIPLKTGNYNVSDEIKYYYPFSLIRYEFKFENTTLFSEYIFSYYDVKMRDYRRKNQISLPLLSGIGHGIGLGLKLKSRISFGLKKEFISFPSNKYFKANFDINSLSIGLPFN